MTPLDLDEIGRSHKNAMLSTPTGRALALACSEIQQLRAEVERLRVERNFLTALYHSIEWLTDPEETIVGINPGPEQEAIQRAYDEARAYYIDCEAAEAAKESH